MTDFELMETVSSLFDSMFMLLMAYFSIVLAFLVTSWKVAGRMNRKLAAVTLGLFTLVTLLLGAFTILLAVDLLALGEVILQKVKSGESSLGWIGSAERTATPPLVEVLVAVQSLVYLAAVFFFFQRKKAGNVN